MLFGMIQWVILGVWERSKFFLYKLVVTASLLYAVSASERLHRNGSAFR